MDSFFVSIEMLRHPELRGKPVVVAYDGPRGVVTTASYEARRYGVHSALPMVTARRRCPQLSVLPVDMELYRRGAGKGVGAPGGVSGEGGIAGLVQGHLARSPPPRPPAPPPGTQHPTP